jgi:hypothetical protein
VSKEEILFSRRGTALFNPFTEVIDESADFDLGEHRRLS